MQTIKYKVFFSYQQHTPVPHHQTVRKDHIPLLFFFIFFRHAEGKMPNLQSKPCVQWLRLQ